MSEYERNVLQAEKCLRDVQREFAFSFRGHARDEVPSLALRLAAGPQNPRADIQKEVMVTRPVFDAFALVLVREAKIGADPKQRFLRLMSFGQSDLPWFDILIEGDQDAFIFRVLRVHPISAISSASAS